ncbi:MAG: hypothetical protein A3K22_02080 [Deltaproteobacteria bacterium RBG_16_42_7]|nr:MAG: hypothetical protein A3K22_02080 [Deltaproteobacteria bacterium RBG_16_42_7]
MNVLRLIHVLSIMSERYADIYIYGLIARPEQEPEGVQDMDMDIIPPKNTKKMTANQMAYHLLRESGLNASQATSQLGLSRSFGTLEKRKGQRNYIDAIEKLAPKAIQSLKKISQGQLVGEMADIKGSDVNKACEAILDRVVPIVKSSDSPVNISFTQINLGEYK